MIELGTGRNVTSDSGDSRLNARLAGFVARLADHPGNRIPAACGGLAETMAADFLGNENVMFQKVLQSHQDATLQPAEVSADVDTLSPQ